MIYILQSFYGIILYKIILGNLEIRAALDHHWKFTGVDIDKSHEIYRDDVWLSFLSLVRKYRAYTTYMNLGNIIQVNLALRSFGRVVREVSG
jgi:hypothetical protein